MNKDLRKTKFAVCCPSCGRFCGKTDNMDAELMCFKCKKLFIASVHDGTVHVFLSKRKNERGYK